MRGQASRLFAAATAAAAMCVSSAASATWSVAAINPETGTIAVAGASCSFMVYGIASVVPGKGVAIVQAASNADARGLAARLLKNGAPLDAIMAKLTDPASGFEPEQQQYALLGAGADARPRTYTGSAVEGAKGSASADHISVQANTMVSDAVVERTFAALGAANWPDDTAMARAVMRAMDAGADVGGDKRCGGSNSASAFIALHRNQETAGQPWLELVVYGIEPGKSSAMKRLDDAFDTWLRQRSKDQSTRVFLVPGHR